jgi:hypothetical protein
MFKLFLIIIFLLNFSNEVTWIVDIKYRGSVASCSGYNSPYFLATNMNMNMNMNLNKAEKNNNDPIEVPDSITDPTERLVYPFLHRQLNYTADFIPDSVPQSVSQSNLKSNLQSKQKKSLISMITNFAPNYYHATHAGVRLYNGYLSFSSTLKTLNKWDMVETNSTLLYGWDGTYFEVSYYTAESTTNGFIKTTDIAPNLFNCDFTTMFDGLLVGGETVCVKPGIYLNTFERHLTVSNVWFTTPNADVSPIPSFNDPSYLCDNIRLCNETILTGGGSFAPSPSGNMIFINSGVINTKFSGFTFMSHTAISSLVYGFVNNYNGNVNNLTLNNNKFIGHRTFAVQLAYIGSTINYHGVTEAGGTYNNIYIYDNCFIPDWSQGPYNIIGYDGIIQNSIVRGNFFSHPSQISSGITFKNGNNFTISNNFFGKDVIGVIQDLGCEYITIRNNTFYENLLAVYMKSSNYLDIVLPLRNITIQNNTHTGLTYKVYDQIRISGLVFNMTINNETIQMTNEFDYTNAYGQLSVLNLDVGTYTAASYSCINEYNLATCLSSNILITNNNVTMTGNFNIPNVNSAYSTVLNMVGSTNNLLIQGNRFINLATTNYGAATATTPTIGLSGMIYRLTDANYDNQFSLIENTDILNNTFIGWDRDIWLYYKYKATPLWDNVSPCPIPANLQINYNNFVNGTVARLGLTLSNDSWNCIKNSPYFSMSCNYWSDSRGPDSIAGLRIDEWYNNNVNDPVFDAKATPFLNTLNNNNLPSNCCTQPNLTPDCSLTLNNCHNRGICVWNPTCNLTILTNYLLGYVNDSGCYPMCNCTSYPLNLTYTPYLNGQYPIQNIQCVDEIPIANCSILNDCNSRGLCVWNPNCTIHDLSTIYLGLPLVNQNCTVNCTCIPYHHHDHHGHHHSHSHHEHEHHEHYEHHQLTRMERFGRWRRGGRHDKYEFNYECDLIKILKPPRHHHHHHHNRTFEHEWEEHETNAIIYVIAAIVIIFSVGFLIVMLFRSSK